MGTACWTSNQTHETLAVKVKIRQNTGFIVLVGARVQIMNATSPKVMKTGFYVCVCASGGLVGMQRLTDVCIL